MVEEALALDVLDTVGERGKKVDASWAPWWRAQSAAIVQVMRDVGHDGTMVETLERRDNEFADMLERDRPTVEPNP